MTDFDRASLDRVLPATAGSSDWDDVLGRSSAHERRRRLITLAVVALTAVVATASSFAVRAIVFDGGGATAFPPEGATPSAPEHGKVVLSYLGRPWGGDPVEQIWVYADGRIIRRTFPGYAGAGRIRTGFLERRLTLEGVDLLRSRIRSTGLVQHDQALWIVWGHVSVNGEWVRRAAGQTKALERLIRSLLDTAALPERVWARRDAEAFVPSKYAICYMRARPSYLPELIDRPSRALRVLPAAARDLLRGRMHTFGTYGVRSRCSELTIEDARALYVILSESGYEPDPFALEQWDAVFTNVRFRAPRPNQALFLAFEPILPHGQWELMPG